jgi:hypothetical protein
VKVTDHQGVHLRIVGIHRSSEDREASKAGWARWDLLVCEGPKVQEVNKDYLAILVNLDRMEILVLLVEATVQQNLKTLNLRQAILQERHPCFRVPEIQWLG